MTEAGRILQRLRDAETIEEVEKVADQERETVMAMQDDPDADVRAGFHQIVNLKKYRIWELTR